MPEQALALAAAAESGSEHPLGRAVLQYASTSLGFSNTNGNEADGPGECLHVGRPLSLQDPGNADK